MVMQRDRWEPVMHGQIFSPGNNFVDQIREAAGVTVEVIKETHSVSHCQINIV